MLHSQKILDITERRPYNATPHHTTPHHRFVSFLQHWLNNEAGFISLVTLLNVTAAGVTLKSFISGLYPFIIESMILTRDVSMSFIMIVISDLLLYYFFRKRKNILSSAKIIIIAVNILTFLADLFTIHYYNYPLNYLMLEIILTTNFREANEFLQAYVMNYDFLKFAVASCAALILAFLVIRAVIRNKAILYFLFVAGTCAGLFSFGHEVIYLSNAHNRPVKSIGLFRIGYMSARLCIDAYNFQRTLLEQKDIRITKAGRNIPYLVFILGEATSRNHMSIYGYRLPTNPYMEERQQKEGLYVFSDVVSPHADTMSVMHELFSFYRYGEKGQWFSYTNIFKILQADGWHTVWLSNQERKIGGDAVYLYTYYCDVKKFTEEFKEVFSQNLTNDDKLLPLLDDELKNEAAKNFYMIQLMGCHAHYHKRYPADKFSRFTMNDEGGLDGITDSKKAIRANYDNAVLYNDYVVNEIIRRFEDKNAIVIYVSDHGEEVYDVANYHGHGDGMPYRNSIEIPFIIWTSPKFRASFPEIEARIASSVDNPYMTDDMIHTLLDILGIETPEYDPAKSIINPKFDSSRSRIYAGKLYDKEHGFHALQ